MFLAEIDNGTPRLTQNDHRRPPMCIPAETTRATSAITENGTEPVFNRRNNSDAVSVVTGGGTCYCIDDYGLREYRWNGCLARVVNVQRLSLEPEFVPVLPDAERPGGVAVAGTLLRGLGGVDGMSR